MCKCQKRWSSRDEKEQNQTKPNLTSPTLTTALPLMCFPWFCSFIYHPTLLLWQRPCLPTKSNFSPSLSLTTHAHTHTHSIPRSSPNIASRFSKYCSLHQKYTSPVCPMKIQLVLLHSAETSPLLWKVSFVHVTNS